MPRITPYGAMAGRISKVTPKAGFMFDGRDVVPANGANVIPLFDGPLKNLMTGRGTSVDRASHNFWYFAPKQPQQLEAAYRSSWLISRIVDLPAKDMTREWRDWQGEADEIERIEAEEKRLNLRSKVTAALILGRLGGGAILLGLSDNDAASPARDGLELRYIHVLSRHQLSVGQEDRDPNSETFGQPTYFQYNGTHIHPSRVVCFKGEYVPRLHSSDWESSFWGDSIIDRVDTAVQNATTATDGFASLIDESKVDIWRLAGLAQAMMTPDGVVKVRNRVEEMAQFKSMHRGMYLDADDTWEARQLNFAGIPDVIKTYMGIVAGAADIPATRLLGKSPDGMNATGDGDMKNYWAKIKSDQSVSLRPALEQIDRFLLPAAKVAKAGFEFAPLDTPTAKELADIEKIFAETVKIIQDTGLVPSGALGKAVENGLIERGQFPGLEGALADEPDMDIGPDEEGGDLPADVEERNTPNTNDAAPRTLYVSRKLLNGADLIKWAKAQGFGDTLTADDMHVTIMYSRKAVDWMEMGETWQSHDNGKFTINEGGARIVDRLGDTGEAIVLLFSSSELSWRHEEMVRKGAGWDWPEYQPHVTIAYDKGELDVKAIEPYRGKLVFGPEIFEELDEDWKAKKGLK